MLVYVQKGHRKHKRRKSKRERRKDAGPNTSAGEERESPSRASDHDADRYFWPDEDEAGPSIRQRISPIFLGERSRSEHPKVCFCSLDLWFSTVIHFEITAIFCLSESFIEGQKLSFIF